MPPRSSTVACPEPEVVAAQPAYAQALDYAQLLRRLLGNLDGMVFRCRNDAHWTMEFVSDGCRQLTGYEAHDLVANLRTSYEQLIVAEDRVRVRESNASQADAPERYALEYRIVRADGEVRTVSERGTAVRDPRGAVVAYEGFIEDITERNGYRVRIEQQANFDALTGLANRRLLNDRLSQAIIQAERNRSRVAVAFIDLDQFKIINDTFGHALGDSLLQTMAERLGECVRAGDTVARQGGDEFVLLLAGHRDAEELLGVIQRVHAAIAQPWQAGRREFHITCSVGVAVYPNDGRSADVLLRNADVAMYKAKSNGRNNFQFFTAELNRLMVERVGIEHRLRNALARKQLFLHYQPRVDVRSGSIVGAEALLRWKMPRQGIISPARFISVAEETGLIVPIGKWVLNTACQQAMAWQVSGLPPLVVSVNVSPRQFRQDNVVATIAEALKDSGLPPQYLQIELTEGLAMHDAEHHVHMLGEIKALGVQIAVDDFGTGYSSLSYLKRFPVDQLKVDRSFVTDLATDPDDAAIVQAIIALGHQLKLKVVAEGVENESQFEYLRRSGCDEMQGYLFGRPMAASEFAEHLARPRNARPLPAS
jgi:diguanylate cyclase (GGDEF)-like protein/PAS domain S-box-containing protein